MSIGPKLFPCGWRVPWKRDVTAARTGFERLGVKALPLPGVDSGWPQVQEPALRQLLVCVDELLHVELLTERSAITLVLHLERLHRARQTVFEKVQQC